MVIQDHKNKMLANQVVWYSNTLDDVHTSLSETTSSAERDLQQQPQQEQSDMPDQGFIKIDRNASLGDFILLENDSNSTTSTASINMTEMFISNNTTFPTNVTPDSGTDFDPLINRNGRNNRDNITAVLFNTNSTEMINNTITPPSLGMFVDNTTIPTEFPNATIAPNTTSLTNPGTEERPGTLAATILSNVFLFFLIFGLSATVSLRSLRSKLKNFVALILGTTMQFIVMPFLGFLAVTFFSSDQGGLTRAMGLTLLVVTSSPGGSYSNLWCSLFNADLALSVAMTAVSTLLSIVMLPLNLVLYSYLAFGASDEANILQALDFGALFTSLGIVLVAIVCGLVAADKLVPLYPDTFGKWANRLGSISGVALILASAFLSGGTGGGMDQATSFWTSAGFGFYASVFLPCLGGVLVSNLLSYIVQLEKPETVSVAIECGYQNTGIATSVAITMFTDPVERIQAVAIPLLYGLVEGLVIGIYCLVAWKFGWTKAPADEKFCTVISTSYEKEEDDDNDDDNNNDVEQKRRRSKKSNSQRRSIASGNGVSVSSLSTKEQAKSSSSFSRLSKDAVTVDEEQPSIHGKSDRHGSGSFQKQQPRRKSQHSSSSREFNKNQRRAPENNPV